MAYFVMAAVLSLGIFIFFFLWNKPILLIYTEIIFILVIRAFITQIGIPEVMKYVAELICLYLFFWALIITKRTGMKTYAMLPMAILILLVILSIMSFLVHDYTLSTYLEGMVKIYRFFAFFYSCIVFLDTAEVKRMYKLLFIFLILNVIDSSVQYFIQGIRWDYNGGLFGITVGGNAEMNVFLVITTVIAVVMGINRKFNMILSGAIVAGGVYIALLSELKIYYIELIFIIIISFLLSKPSIRSFVYLGGGFLGIVFAIKLLGQIYPLFSDFFNIHTIVSYSMKDNYGGTSGNLNRLTALPYIYQHLLKTPVDKLFGIGMGNADVGTAFNNNYKFLKFDWYFDSYYFTENGMLCFALYCLFFLVVSVLSLYFMRKDKKNREYYLISAIIALFPILFMIYDASLLSLVSYLLFMILAVPFILYRETQGVIRRCQQLNV